MTKSQFASRPNCPLKWREANRKIIRKQWPFEGLFLMASVSCIMHHNIKTRWEVEVYFHTFLILALDRDERSASCPGHFTPGYSTSQYTLDRRQGRLQRNLLSLSSLKLEEADFFETQVYIS
jgi:hypothetical protein